MAVTQLQEIAGYRDRLATDYDLAEKSAVKA